MSGHDTTVKIHLPRALEYWYIRGRGKGGLPTKSWARATLDPTEEGHLDAVVHRWYRAAAARTTRSGGVDLDLAPAEAAALLKCATEIDRWYLAKNANGTSRHPVSSPFGRLGEETRVRALINQGLILHLQQVLTASSSPNQPQGTKTIQVPAPPQPQPIDRSVDPARPSSRPERS